MDEKILRRMRHLQALADQPVGNEEEAALAAERLTELMTKYQIEDLEALPSESPVGVEEGRVDTEDENAPPSRVERWDLQLLTVVVQALGGKPWIRGKGRRQELRMVGPVDAVRTARYMYHWLRGQINRMARRRARELDETANAWRRAYCTGVVTKVYKRMADARRVVVDASSSTALVLVDRQKVAVETRFAELGDLRKSKNGNLRRQDAANLGWSEGDTVDLGQAGAAALGQGQRKLRS